MKLQIDLELKDLDDPLHEPIRVDRSGSKHDHGREGFTIYLDGLRIEFYDEAVALKLAEKIAERQGGKIVRAP